jgi:hypothetical protein
MKFPEIFYCKPQLPVYLQLRAVTFEVLLLSSYALSPTVRNIFETPVVEQL